MPPWPSTHTPSPPCGTFRFPASPARARSRIKARQMPRAPRISPVERRRPPTIAAATRAPAPRRRRFRWLRLAIIASVWGTLALALVLLWFARDLPRPESALDAARRPSLTLEDRTGHVFATLRRRGRRAAAPDRHAALPAGSRRGGGGPALLAPPRHRPDRPGARRLDRPGCRPRRAGRLHHHPAGGEEPVPDQRPHLPPQGAGTAADALAGAAFHQAGDPRDLAEPRLSRLRRLGRGRGGAHLFRRLRPPA